MKAPEDESGINKDFTEKSTDWIATAPMQWDKEHHQTKLVFNQGRATMYWSSHTGRPS